MVTEATMPERPRRAGVEKQRAELTRVDELAERRARRVDQVARQLDEAEGFVPPAEYQECAPRALLVI